ncbi:auxin-induced protein 15A-like [Nymphaea colorata]|uniref:Uncharacterized protein n=1 Tax=Nymphaea colorata TaxID=210225 RepID=A0A5K1AEL1_9MAGN|nr:auxin-induced protein 15A-like [Nymphaea colorata]
MGIRLPQLVLAKKAIQRTLSSSRSSVAADTPKGHFAVYVGESRRRFVVPTSYLKNPIFLELLEKAEEEFGYNSSMGLTIPCDEDAFMALIEQLS